MILVSHRGTEEGHDPIARELIDCALVLVDLVHQDLEAPIHDLVDFLGVEFLGDGGVIRHVGEEDGYELSFALDGTAGREDFIGKVFWSVGLRYV